jgi:transcriptional regulator with GAF, ATPase, and Fis domain
MEQVHYQISQLQDKINSYGKENLEEMLFAAAEGIELVTGHGRIRFYLEDLTRGALSCLYASGPFSAEIKKVTFPIISDDALVSRVFVTQSVGEIRDTGAQALFLDREMTGRFSIAATFLLPIVSQGRSLGVLCIDRERKGEMARVRGNQLLNSFLAAVSDSIDHAWKYHQQILLARRVEEYKKREAAAFMVKSAVQLIDRIALASVLVPTVSKNGEVVLERLASHSEEPELKARYDAHGSIGLKKGLSLLAKYVGDDGVINDDRLLKPLFIADLAQQIVQKREFTEKMALRSLYVVPRYEPDTRKVICLVNYYTREIHRFSEFETGLLQVHAEMVERVIREIGGEHLEIRVLAEITDLLQARNEALHPFLSKVLSKATELIGADTGSIGIVQEIDGEKRLVVEDANGNIVGAKNKEWLKKNIPPMKIGGFDLPLEERSLTGYVAWAKQAKIISNVDEEQRSEGFHRSMSELIRSEIAMPVICDDEVIAVICLNSLKPAYFTEDHKRILQIIERLTSRHISDIQQIEKLQSEVNRLASDVAYKDPHVYSYRLGNIIGNSRKAQEVVEFINRVSVPLINRIALWSSNIIQEATIGLPSILVLGQTGAGKEFFFNNLYNKLNEMYREQINPGGELPVKKTNIAAYSGELTYSELFGHKKGAFTGAYSDRKGILEEAQGGIVFLDEIGDADPKTQVQLLRFLDNGGFFRLGDNLERYSRVLLVAATNRNLLEDIKNGRFREDLYHRLSELSVKIPQLSERREDIPDLAVHFLGKLYRTYRGKDENPEDSPALTEEAKKVLVNHRYRGNIRELRSILLRALFFRRGKAISGEDITRAIREGMKDEPETTRDTLNDRLAGEILAEIENGGNFWDAVYGPFSRNTISRDVVRAVIEKARFAAGNTMPQIADYLKAIAGDIRKNSEEKKKFFKFKNFLYKTVKIA